MKTNNETERSSKYYCINKIFNLYQALKKTNKKKNEL